MNLFQRRLLDQISQEGEFQPSWTALYVRWHEIRRRHEAEVISDEQLLPYLKEMEGYLNGQLHAFREFRRDERRSLQRHNLSRVIVGLNSWLELILALAEARGAEIDQLFSESLGETEQIEKEIREGTLALKAA